MTTHEYKNHTIYIVVDNDPENSRSWDNLGTMVCFHNRYKLGDEHSFSNPEEVSDFLKETSCIYLSLFLYDHSGITMNTTGFSYPWDSGQVGIIYATKKSIKEEYGVKRISLKLAQKIEKILRDEVKTYDQYLRNDVYGYDIVNKEDEDIDSCYGFYGKEYCLKEAKEVIDYIER